MKEKNKIEKALIVVDMVNGFIKEGNMKDNSIQRIIPENAVDTYDAPYHKKDEYNEMAFKLMKQAGISLVKKYEMKRGI